MFRADFKPCVISSDAGKQHGQLDTVGCGCGHVIVKDHSPEKLGSALEAYQLF
jgi:hypothetical protein